MAHDPVTKWNAIDLRTVTPAIMMLASLAAVWGVLNYRVNADALRIDQLEKRSDVSSEDDAKQDQALAVIQNDITTMKMTVGEIKGQQQAFQQSTEQKLNEQSQILNKILWELKRGNGSTP